MFEHLSGIGLGIDTFLVKNPWGLRGAVFPGRTGPPASVCFTLLGIALVLLGSRESARRLVPLLGLGVSAMATLSLMGYLFNADPLFSRPRVTGIALQTATILLALGLAVVLAVPENPPLSVLRENSAGQHEAHGNERCDSHDLLL